MLKGKIYFVAALMVLLGMGCGALEKDPVKRQGLRYDPVNYERLDRNGTVVYRLSPEGKEAIQDGDNRFNRKSNRKWWQIW